MWLDDDSYSELHYEKCCRSGCPAFVQFVPLQTNPREKRTLSVYFSFQEYLAFVEDLILSSQGFILLPNTIFSQIGAAALIDMFFKNCCFYLRAASNYRIFRNNLGLN